MPDKEFVDRIKDGEIQKIDKKLIDEEFEKIGPAVVKRGEDGGLTYFLYGLCGVNLSNVDVSRIKWKFTRKNNF
jgi:hypothetical protein